MIARRFEKFCTIEKSLAGRVSPASTPASGYFLFAKLKHHSRADVLSSVATTTVRDG